MTLTQTDAMALTLVIEGAVALALGPAFARGPWRCAAAALLASSITHPILWAIYGDAHALLDAFTTPVLEALIIVAEALAYRALATPRWDEAVLFSLLVNAASWWAGELIYVLT